MGCGRLLWRWIAGVALVESHYFGARGSARAALVMSFDILAPHYRWMEAVLAGDKLQRCRVHWLGAVQHCRRALLVGEGNGRFLQVCAERLPNTHFTVVDASPKMLREAELRWRKARGGNRATF